MQYRYSRATVAENPSHRKPYGHNAREDSCLQSERMIDMPLLGPGHVNLAPMFVSIVIASFEDPISSSTP